jgi:hypothetical protein
MAKQDFDFAALKELKPIKYLKMHCKPMAVKKATSGLVFMDYKLAGKKQAIVFVPFRKFIDAKEAYKLAKKTKENKIAKTGLVDVVIDSKTNKINLTIREGGLAAEALTAKGADFFKNNFKLELQVGVNAETVATDEVVEEKEEPTKENAAAEKKRKASYQKIGENIDKLQAAVGNIPNAKVEANVAKFKAALSKMEGEVEANGEEGKTIADLKSKLVELEEAISGSEDSSSAASDGPAKAKKGKKLTPKNRKQINKNIIKIQKRLDAMMKSLESDLDKI